MFNRPAVIIIIAAAVLLSGEAFALAYGLIPRRADGTPGILLVAISIAVVALLLKQVRPIPADRAAPVEQNAKSRSFSLYIGLFAMTFAFVKTLSVTRNEALFLRVGILGVGVIILGLVISGIYISKTALR